jgi:hypothetical protein
MGTLRSTPAILRALLATIFLFMGAVHAPLMIATASAGPAADAAAHTVHHHPASHGHRHNSLSDNIDNDAGRPKPPSLACASFDCCVAVTSPAAPACAPGNILLATLKPLPPAAVSPVTPERADPPPRLSI